MVEISQKILDASDGGREIILQYYPQAAKAFQDFPKKTSFKIRESEATGSAYVKRLKNGVWICTDFGDDSTGRNGINVCMKEEGYDFGEAISKLAKQYGLSGDKPKSKTDFKKPTKKDKLGTTYEYFDTISDSYLSILGPKVTQNICNRYKLKAAKSFTIITEPSEDKEGKIIASKKIVVKSTKDYPIFVFDHTTWQKRYEPLHEDKGKRFRHSGDKPVNYVNGLDFVIRTQKEYAETIKENWEKENEPTKNDLKLDSVIIGSGDRDSLNIDSFNYNVIWLNSESDKLTFEVYKQLKEICKNIYVLYDIDNTGKKQAIDLALEFTDIKIIWLPKWLSYRKDFRGKPRKDFRDLVQISYYKNNESQFEGLLKKMIKNAMPMRFWDENWKKSRTTDEWYCKYDFNNAYAMHFIEHQGFFLYENDQSKDDYEFINVDGNVVETVRGHHIKKHLLNYLERKNHPIDLRNMLLKTNQLSDKSLSQLNALSPRFRKGFVNSQYLFFKDSTWYITKNGTKKYKLGEVSSFVWKNDIIDFTPKIEDNYFTIAKHPEKGFDITLNNDNVMYLNYLINTARVYWKAELENPYTKDGNLDFKAQQAYLNENRFNIAGSNLSEEQIWEQKQHLVNKIYTIGYLLHSFKDVTKSWFVWNMDYEIVDDLESNGGTGKSLFFKMLFPILKNIKKIDGRERNIADKDFLFDGVTDKTDLLLIEDMDAYFRAHRFLNPITDDMIVNPKGHTAYTVKHEDSPKLAGTSNFGVGNMDGALRRRLLFTATGDYYHEKGDKYNESRQVSDDFNGKRLINDFTDENWNRYYNFCAQCIGFYLSQPKRINPPLENVEKRNLIRDMKSPFKTWADTFFADGYNLNELVIKKEAHDDCKAEGMPKLTAARFKTSLISWCKLYGYEFNPEEHESVKDGRIMKRPPGQKAKEYFYIKTNKDVLPKTEKITSVAEDDEKTVFDQDDNDDFKFS